MSLSDSDGEEGLKKMDMAHEEYNIPQSICKPDIERFYNDIHSNIEELNVKLLTLFKKKEDDLCDTYKQEMTKAQKHLRELQESTSEQEFNKRKIEKKEKLQKERQKYLETSLYFSKQCKEFKSTLTKVVNTTKDLESEINFLNEQILFADKHHKKLTSELNDIKNQIRKYDPSAQLDKFEEILINNLSLLGKNELSIQKNYSKTAQNSINTNNNISNINGKLSFGYNHSMSINQIKYVSPYNKADMMKVSGGVYANDLEKAKQELIRQKEMNEKLTEFLNDPCFEETEFERLFLECVLSVKQRKIQQNSAQKLPLLRSAKGSKNDLSQQRSNESTLDYTTISECDFNEFNKRQVVEEFLSKQEIKKYIYSLIFTKKNNTKTTQKQKKLIKTNNKTAISNLQTPEVDSSSSKFLEELKNN